MKIIPGRRGVALASVLLVVMMLSVLAVAIVTTTTSQVRFSLQRNKGIVSRETAVAGINEVFCRLDKEGQSWKGVASAINNVEKFMKENNCYYRIEVVENEKGLLTVISRGYFKNALGNAMWIKAIKVTFKSNLSKFCGLSTGTKPLENDRPPFYVVGDSRIDGDVSCITGGNVAVSVGILNEGDNAASQQAQQVSSNTANTTLASIWAEEAGGSANSTPDPYAIIDYSIASMLSSNPSQQLVTLVNNLLLYSMTGTNTGNNLGNMQNQVQNYLGDTSNIPSFSQQIAQIASNYQSQALQSAISSMATNVNTGGFQVLSSLTQQIPNFEQAMMQQLFQQQSNPQQQNQQAALTHTSSEVSTATDIRGVNAGKYSSGSQDLSKLDGDIYARRSDQVKASDIAFNKKRYQIRPTSDDEYSIPNMSANSKDFVDVNVSKNNPFTLKSGYHYINNIKGKNGTFIIDTSRGDIWVFLKNNMELEDCSFVFADGDYNPRKIVIFGLKDESEKTKKVKLKNTQANFVFMGNQYDMDIESSMLVGAFAANSISVKKNSKLVMPKSVASGKMLRALIASWEEM